MPEHPSGEEGLLMSHAYLLLDGSGSMHNTELLAGKPKHRAVAEMIQDLIKTLKDDDQIQDILLSVICYDGNRVDDVRLSAYDIKASEEYYQQPPYAERDLDRWDPLVGHNGTTPIGRALAFSRQMAEEWVKSAPRGAKHRAVICLLSDGMNFPETEPNGIDERNKIVDFNNSQEEQARQGGDSKGRIRIATVGYYQSPEGQNKEEDEGRKLLKALAYPERAYFETREAKSIARFLRQTILLFGQER